MLLLLPHDDLKPWLPFKAVPFLLLLATTWFENRDAFYDRTMDYELLLLGLATAPWAEILTNFIAALSLLLLELKSRLPFESIPFQLLLATTWFQIVTHFRTGLRTTCCSFFGWLQRLGLKLWRISVPFLLLLATTWFEFVTHLTTGLRAVSSWAGYSALGLGLKSWRVWKQYHSCCFLPQHDLKSWCILWQDYVLSVPSWDSWADTF